MKAGYRTGDGAPWGTTAISPRPADIGTVFGRNRISLMPTVTMELEAAGYPCNVRVGLI
jgi:hypothetical protein